MITLNHLSNLCLIAALKDRGLRNLSSAEDTTDVKESDLGYVRKLHSVPLTSVELNAQSRVQGLVNASVLI